MIFFFILRNNFIYIFNLYKCCYCCNVFYRSMWVFFFQTVQKIQQMKVIIVAVYLILIEKVYTERMSNLPLNRLLYVCMYVIKNLTTFSQHFVGLLAFFDLHFINVGGVLNHYTTFKHFSISYNRVLNICMNNC